MKLYFESRGITDKVKKSLRTKVKEYINSVTGIGVDNIDLVFNNTDIHPDIKIKVGDGELIYRCSLRPSGREDAKRLPKLLITNQEIKLKADGLICRYNTKTDSLYLVDKYGNEVFRISGLSDMGYIHIPDDAYADKTEPKYDDNLDNLIYNNSFNIRQLVKKIEKDVDEIV